MKPVLPCLRALIGAIAIIAFSNAAHASLVSTDGGLGVYDTVNNVTWTSNANLMATQAASYSGGSAAFVAVIIADSNGVIHDTPSAYDPSGTYTLSANDFNATYGGMTWWGAQAWVNYLNVTNYGGSSAWSLPSTVDSNSSAGYPDGAAGNPPQSSSQLAELFYGGLGQVESASISGTHNGSYALFSNVVASPYWSGTEYPADSYYAWVFNAGGGVQDGEEKGGAPINSTYALAVSPGELGQVSAVPLPTAAWLLFSGLGGLGVITRKRKAPDSCPSSTA